MAVSVETLLKRSSDRLGAVHPRIREYALELIKRAYKEGIRVQLSSGFRSNTDQAYIYGQGRPNYVWNGKQYGRPGSIVSNAPPGSSVHNYGLAIDYFLVSEDGNSSLWTVNAQWRRVAALAKSMGWEWGGDWTSFRDYPHLQITGGLSIAQLAAGKRPTIPPLSGATPAPAKPNPSTAESIVDYLNAKGQDSSFTARAKLAKAHGIPNYSGSAAQNTQLLAELKKPVTPVSKPKPKPEVSGNSAEKDVEALELAKAQREELAKIFKKARERGVFTSTEHEKAIVAGTMTVSRLLYLQSIIAGAALNGGKRIQ